MQADLHIHSNCSDGLFSPSDVVRRVHAAGIGSFALTDHDTAAGLVEARECADGLGLVMYAGAEISATIRGDEVHLLAYGFLPTAPVMESLFSEQKRRRLERALTFVDRFRLHGIVLDVPLAEWEKKQVARPHLAKMLVEAGAAEDRNQAFEKWLIPGTPTFVSKEFPDARDVVDWIHAADGIVSLAHPGHFTSHAVVLDLIGAGLDALETVHPSHDDSLTSYYTDLAVERGLSQTGGSDFHGWRNGDDDLLGRYVINDQALRNLIS